MTDAPSTRDGDRSDDRPIADGGHTAAPGPIRRRAVVDRTRETPATDVPPLGTDRGEHLFAPAELPRDALALPVLAALAVAVATQSSAVLGAGGAEAWFGSVAIPVAAIGAVLLTLRFV